MIFVRGMEWRVAGFSVNYVRATSIAVFVVIYQVPVNIM